MVEIEKRHITSAGMVSIITPVFNAEKFLHKSIESVLSQSYEKIEMILVNDGSTDNSEAVCNSYAITDERIRVFSQKNGGPAAARNTGIRYAKGDFIYFLDADDYIEHNTIERLVMIYDRHHGPDMVMSNFNKLEIRGELVRQRVTFCAGDRPFEGDIKELSRADMVDYVRHFLRHPSNHLISYCWARLYKTSIVREKRIFSDENMRLFEDFAFNLKYLKYARRVIFVNECLYTYTMHNNASASMAVINSNSLLHDMSIFKKSTTAFLESASLMDSADINKEIGHALVHYVIIFLVRSCRQIAGNNKKTIHDEIDNLIRAPILRESLRYYSPSRGNSRILPLLMRFGLIDLLMILGYYKACKRYGKP